MADAAVVAIINCNADLLALLKAQVESAGFVALTIDANQIRRGLDIARLLDQYRAGVVVYDIERPYERNWQLFEHLRALSSRSRGYIITTPNKRALMRVTKGNHRLFELADEGDDFLAVVEAIRQADSQVHRPARGEAD